MENIIGISKKSHAWGPEIMELKNYNKIQKRELKISCPGGGWPYFDTGVNRFIQSRQGSSLAA